MKLYDYWRSGASFRVRIALNIKGIDYQQQAVNLIKDGGQQHNDDYRAINPQGFVPALVTNGESITQSMAIIEYLNEVHPNPPLLPAEPLARARVRAMANVIAADTHPIQNLRILQKLKAIDFDQTQVNEWGAHWIEQGFASLERMLDNGPKGEFFFGDTVTLADIAIAPQMLNAERFEADLSKTPRVVEKIKRLFELPEFDKAKPENQPDAPQ